MSKLSKMNKTINKLVDEPFEYGKNDCYTFTSRLVKEWHGKDFTKLHAVYKSKEQADKYMKEFGGIEALTTGTLGYSVNPVKCEDGDVVTAEVAPGEVALGFVFNGHGLFRSKIKLYKLSLDKCRMGWRIA
jgi:hypothetical protein